jgi:aldose 1-epimerase
MFLLLPFSNRISGGGFIFEGTFYPLAPNVPGESYPIHGGAYDKCWDVIESGPAYAALRLATTGEAFSYAASVSYTVDGGALTVDLSVENRGPRTMPFGLGLHPWLVRTPDVTLQAGARGVWQETDDHLRAGDAPVPIPPEWDFVQSKPLPRGFVNNGFSGWTGTASVTWPSRKLRLDIHASPVLSTYIVYSPSARADFFCFEPVSHPVDALNLPNASQHGVAVLEPGANLAGRTVFTVQRQSTPRP